MKTYRWSWHFESGGRRTDERAERTDHANSQTPGADLDDLPLALKAPMPIEEERDKVMQASWESFPASDAPPWRGRESGP